MFWIIPRARLKFGGLGQIQTGCAEEAYQYNAKNYSRNLLVSWATLENVIESTRWNVETKGTVAVEDVFDFSIVRGILKEMGETAK